MTAMPIDFGDTILRNNAGNYFDLIASVFDLFGFDDAAKKLRYYRSSRGGSLILDDQEIARHPIYSESVDLNRTRFESDTFTGRSQNKEKITLEQKLLAIPDGGSARIDDSWDVNIKKSDPSTYLNFGRFALKSGGDFEVSRNGDKFTWSGVVDHRLGADHEDSNGKRTFIPERFDFNPGQPGKIPADVAERYGAAAPFDLVYPNRQRVDAQVVYDPTPTEQFPDGRFTVERVDWRPLGEGPDGRGWWGRDWDPFAANGKLEFDP
jgi:hypothetical protein